MTDSTSVGSDPPEPSGAFHITRDVLLRALRLVATNVGDVSSMQSVDISVLSESGVPLDLRAETRVDLLQTKALVIGLQVVARMGALLPELADRLRAEVTTYLSKAMGVSGAVVNVHIIDVTAGESPEQQGDE